MAEPPIDILIRTPDVRAYGLALLVVYSLGSINLAAMVHRRWFFSTGVRFLDIYSAAMVLPCLWGIALLGLGAVFGTSGLGWALCVPVGLAAGTLAAWADRRVVRTAKRRSAARQSPGLNRSAAAQLGVESQSLQWRGFVSKIDSRKRRVLGFDRGQRTYGMADLQREFRLPSVVAVAIMQETIYRGVMVRVSFLLPHTTARILALVGLVVAFALVHMWFGWVQVLAKLPLSALTMAAALALGTVAPAIVAHVLFNIEAIRDMQPAGNSLGGLTA
jgi:hypothetical protein